MAKTEVPEKAIELIEELCVLCMPWREAEILAEARAEALRDAADRAWPLLKQEYVWRHENSECGGDEISEGLDILKSRLCAAITQEETNAKEN